MVTISNLLNISNSLLKLGLFTSPIWCGVLFLSPLMMTDTPINRSKYLYGCLGSIISIPITMGITLWYQSNYQLLDYKMSILPILPIISYVISFILMRKDNIWPPPSSRYKKKQ